MLLNSERSRLPQRPGLLTRLMEEHGVERGICYEPVVLGALRYSSLHLEREELNLVNNTIYFILKE